MNNPTEKQPPAPAPVSVDNERDANELVDEMFGSGEKAASGVVTETALSLGLDSPAGPELGEHVFKLALDRRRENMQQAVIDYVIEQMRIHVALQLEIERCQKALDKTEARLKAIKAGEFSLNQKSGKITFNDKELGK